MKLNGYQIIESVLVQEDDGQEKKKHGMFRGAAAGAGIGAGLGLTAKYGKKAIGSVVPLSKQVTTKAKPAVMKGKKVISPAVKAATKTVQTGTGKFLSKMGKTPGVMKAAGIGAGIGAGVGLLRKHMDK